MSEEARLNRDLDDSTVRFIRNSARELIEELGFRDNTETGPSPVPSTASPVSPAAVAMCIPVRDETDELAATMLAQALNRSPLQAFAPRPRGIADTAASVDAEKPGLVFLSGMPPFALSRSHRLYRVLRDRYPQLRIMIAIWNYQGDATDAARRISGGEEVRVFTRLADAVAEVRSKLAPAICGFGASGTQPEPTA